MRTSTCQLHIVDNFTDNNGNGHDDGVGVAPLTDPDFDGDGIVDHLDIDSDNDGLPDLLESMGLNADVDGDGRLDNFVDANGDGLSDGINANALLDTDSDSAPNHLDVDSDNDNIFDLVEAGGIDTDDDGQVDAWADSDNDGINDTIDADFTGGLDSDNDGIIDIADADNATGADSDNDGIIDLYDDDVLNSGYVPFNAGMPLIGSTLPDTNGNNVPDVLEAIGDDADADGIIHTGLAGSGCSVVPGKSGSVDPMLLLLMLGSVGVFFTRRSKRADQQRPLNNGDAQSRENTTPAGGVTGGVAAIAAASVLVGCSSLSNNKADQPLDSETRQVRYDTEKYYPDRIRNHVYIAAGIGSSWLEPDTSEVRGVGVNDRVNSGGQFTLGMDLSRQVALELHTADLGSAGLTSGGQINYRSHGLSTLFYAGKQRHYYRRHGLTGYGRIGLGVLENSSTNGVNYQQDNSAHVLFGAGIEYMTRKGLGLRAEAIAYEEDVRYGQLALIYRTGKREQRKIVDVVKATPEPIPVIPIPAVKVIEPVTEYNACTEFNGVLEVINFHTDSAQLTDEAVLVMDSAARKLLNCDFKRLSISAHTDSVGPESYNMALSKKRAISVVRNFQARGIAISRMRATAFGETKPIDTNATAEGRHRNRRVEVIAQ